MPQVFETTEDRGGYLIDEREQDRSLEGQEWEPWGSSMSLPVLPFPQERLRWAGGRKREDFLEEVFC